MSAVLSRNPSRVDQRIVARQQAGWASGDYAVAGDALQTVSEELCETVKLCADERVLDVAPGDFQAALAAARRWCAVTATDDVTDVARRSRSRLDAASVGVRFADGDAAALPFPDQSFDAVLSAFGVMFALDQERAASEMIRVCRRGGRVGLTAWTPDGLIGRLFETVHVHLPGPPPDSPFCWGTEDRLDDLFTVYGRVARTAKRVTLRARTIGEWVHHLRSNYLPIMRAFTALGPSGQESLSAELVELARRFNQAKDGTMAVGAEYLEVVVKRR